jgi:ribose 5-phosphate isomerase B
MLPRLVTERTVLDAAAAGRTEVLVAPKTLITALARDAARTHGIVFAEQTAPPTGAATAVLPGTTPPAAEAPAKTLALGCDHAGFAYKSALRAHAEALGWTVTDVGTDSEESVDYPDFAFAVGRLVQQRAVRFGLMIDGVGVGSSIVANKLPGVRAALCPDVFSAYNARAHNDANVLTLGSRVMGIESCKRVLAEFLSVAFEGGRHAGRVQKIGDVEARFLPGR